MKAGKGTLYDIKSECRICWLYLNDERYRKLWGDVPNHAKKSALPKMKKTALTSSKNCKCGSVGGAAPGSTPVSCFPAGTMVEMAGGEKARIETLVAGDKLRSLMRDGTPVIGVVTEVVAHGEREALLISTDNGRVRATATQKFWQGGGTFISSPSPGDKLMVWQDVRVLGASPFALISGSSSAGCSCEVTVTLQPGCKIEFTDDNAYALGKQYIDAAVEDPCGCVDKVKINDEDVPTLCEDGVLLNVTITTKSGCNLCLVDGPKCITPMFVARRPTRGGKKKMYFNFKNLLRNAVVRKELQTATVLSVKSAGYERVYSLKTTWPSVYIAGGFVATA